MTETDLQPGFELDAAVARIVLKGDDHKITINDWGHDKVSFCQLVTSNGTERNFRPSTDLDDALWAAEKCGMISPDKQMFSLHHDNFGWECSFLLHSEYCDYDLHGNEIPKAELGFNREFSGNAPTPAHAVCLAILKWCEGKR